MSSYQIEFIWIIVYKKNHDDSKFEINKTGIETISEALKIFKIDD